MIPSARRISLALVFILAFAPQVATAQSSHPQPELQPKYGSLPKNELEKSADAKFLAAIDRDYQGDRKKAAADVANLGWKYFKQGDAATAMKRFNQAWLLDNANASALWGMAVVQGSAGKLDEALKLFAEADPLVGRDIDFSVDYAKALGVFAAKTENPELLKEAFARFKRIYEQSPQHTLNLQNWAITSFYVGDYSEAWRLVKLAEATPHRSELDPRFLAALQSKMPRP